MGNSRYLYIVWLAAEVKQTCCSGLRRLAARRERYCSSLGCGPECIRKTAFVMVVVLVERSKRRAYRSPTFHSTFQAGPGVKAEALNRFQDV